MSELAGLILAFVAVHAAVHRWGPTFGVITSVHATLAGLVAGPVLGALVVTSAGTASLLQLVAAVTGVLVGLRARVPRLAGLERDALRYAGWWGAGVSVVFAATGVVLGVEVGGGLDAAASWGPSVLTLVGFALAAEPGSLGALLAVHRRRGWASDFAARVSRYLGLGAILVSGAAHAFGRPEPELFGYVFQSWTWVLGYLLFGPVIGLGFAVVLGRVTDRGWLGVAVLGAGALAAGAAAAAGISPLFVGAVAGWVAAHASPRASGSESLLQDLEPPLALALMFGAGLLLVPIEGGLWVYGSPVAFLVLRGAGRRLGELLGRARVRSAQPHPWFDSALFSPGILGAAVVISMPGATEAPGTVAASLAVSLLAAELLAWPRSRSWVLELPRVEPPEEVRS